MLILQTLHIQSSTEMDLYLILNFTKYETQECGEIYSIAFCTPSRNGV